MWATAIQDIIAGDVVAGLFELILAFVSSLVKLILLPFSALIQFSMPDLSQALTQVSVFFDLAGTYMSWIIDSLAIPPIVVTMVAGYWAFVFTTTFGTWAIKLLLKWKKALWA